MAGHVLLIDADVQVQQQVKDACAELQVELRHVDDIEAAIESIALSRPELVLLDVGLSRSDDDGLANFSKLRDRWPRLCTILIAERARSEQAIQAMKRGAIDYLLKPLKHPALVSHIENALRISRNMTVPTVYESVSESPGDRIVGQSPAMHEVFKLVGLIAPRDVNVLITGESGTGKELVAKALYHHSQRRDHPFLAVNCAAIPETLLESELFGHERGAFTGADMRRIGKFEQCTGGTLFLDEIGDLPLATQAKLLRVLQDGSFQRLGSAATIRCDVRIIAATNQNLVQLMDERRFRRDLYYRLKVTSIDLPPLRDREVDAVLLAHYFVKRFNPPMGTQIQRFSPEVLPVLLSHPWPGNVRELENVIKASLVVAQGNVFQVDFLPEEIRSVHRRAQAGVIPIPTRDGTIPAEGDLGQTCRRLLAHEPAHGRLYKEVLRFAEREVIQACLTQTSGRLAPAARLLGITRTTLRKKMAELDIKVNTTIDPR